MNIPFWRLKVLLSNPHTSWAAGIYFVAKAGSAIALTWCPSHADQIKKTADIIEATAVSYGFLMAGDAKQSIQVSEPQNRQPKDTNEKTTPNP